MSALRTLVKAAAKTAVAAPVAWIAYSRFGVDHDLPMPRALSSDSGNFRSDRAGVVHYYHDKSGSGRPLVLVHSINAAASPREMASLFEHYRGARPVYAIDLPGFGFSDRSERAYSPQLYADVIRQFMDEVIGEPSDVIALSLGSEFAAIAAEGAPDSVRSLALISPTGFTGDGAEGRSEQASRDGSAQRSYDLLSFPLWSQAIYDLIVSRPSLRFYNPDEPADEREAEERVEYSYRISHQPGAKNAPLYFVSGRLFTRDIATTVYPKLSMPTLALYDQGRFVSYEKLPQVLDSNPVWRAVRIPGGGSLPHDTRTAETTAALDAFWASLDAEA